MAIYRGPGGPGDATQDAASEVLLAVQAKEAAQAAQAAAEAAQAAAELAETNAETAETNAELAETNAETAETNAETAATNAASSASAASTSASNAASSASAASTSASNAATSATNASNSASAASTSATNAATSATNASNSASAASTSATNASNSASSASTSATNAANSATAAANSATAAAASATAAAGYVVPSQTGNAGKYLKTDGSATSWDALDISTADITGTLPIANGGTGATTDSGARTNLGLGSIATQAASSVTITGGSINGTTIGASTATSGAFTSLTSSSTTTLNGTTIPASKTLVVTTDIGSTVQAYDAQLADVAGLTPADNNFIVGNGTNFVTESGSTARTSLGLGTIATQAANNVAITGGSINGTTVGGTTAAAGKFTTLEATGVTTVQAGTASAPAITTSGDTNTGIYFPAADTIAFTEGGVEAMRINSVGQVGIGTSSPSYRLHVVATDATAGYFNGSGAVTTIDLDNTNANGWGSNIAIRTGGTAAGYFGTIGSLLGSTAQDLAVYATASNGFRVYTNGNNERMRIDSSGNVGIGEASPDTRLHVYGASTAGRGQFYIQGSSTTSRFVMANSSDAYSLNTYGDSSTSLLTWDTGSGYSFRWTTADTERMRITSGGAVCIAKTGNNIAVVGFESLTTGETNVTVSGSECMNINRNTSDGDLIRFRQDNTVEGSISVSGTTVSYNGGHLSRWSQWQNQTGKPKVYRGTVLESTNDMCEWDQFNEQATKVIVSTTAKSKAVAGVFDMYDTDDEDNPYDFYVAQSGDFVIRIAQGVIVVNGDLLESAGDGTARPQTDDICRSSTIAKVTSNYVSTTYADGSYCVPCILMIG